MLQRFKAAAGVVSVVSLTGATARGSGWVWNPAGGDELLALACKDIEAGRFGVARDALAASRSDFALRSARSMLLGSVAAGSDVAEHWFREQPGDPDALLLAARVAVVRARRAPDRGSGVFAELVGRAWDRCRDAAAVFPGDPTPWVAMLALASVDGSVMWPSIDEAFVQLLVRHEGESDLPLWTKRSVPGRVQVAYLLEVAAPVNDPPAWSARRVADALGELMAPGPWDLMLQVWLRDPLGREGYRWMLECLPVQDAHAFASLIAAGTPRSAVTQLLPLVAHLKQYQWLADRGPAADVEGSAGAVWRSPALHATCLDAYEGWFPSAVRGSDPVPVADFSLLAHALFQVGEHVLAANVLEAMRPFASTFPWSVTGGGDGEREFLRAAKRLRVSAPRAMSGWELRERARYG